MERRGLQSALVIHPGENTIHPGENAGGRVGFAKAEIGLP
jgi:hypothetical protein